MSKTAAMPIPSRRAVLHMLSAGAALPFLPGAAYAVAEPGIDPVSAGQPFSFDLLTEAMRRRAESPDPGPAQLPLALPDLDYDGYRRIAFEPSRARWQEEGDLFRIMAFHRGWLHADPVSLYDISGGTAEPMIFTARDFRYYEELEGRLDPDAPLPGIAGWRLHSPINTPGVYDELIAFLGASYFRALGQGNHYGASARGLALDTATDRKEEFPRFSAFYVEKPVSADNTVRVYAALDSARVTGAYRFVITPGGPTEMEITARLFFREDVGELGVAPLTSMFLYDETTPGRFNDYRPQVHDSQGLAIRFNDGGRVWRQLANPPRLGGSWFHVDKPAAFGLYQRDRDFNAYQDAGARYELRPSLKVEPLGDWGPGHVRLVEIPADLEIYDNVVAYWTPDQSPRAGESREYAYRLSWGSMGAEDAHLARVVRTSSGHAGVAGVAPQGDGRKFVIDFVGSRLSRLDPEMELEPQVRVSGGEATNVSLAAVTGTGLWRLSFDVTGAGSGVTELDAWIDGFGETLTERWSYQWITA